MSAPRRHPKDQSSWDKRYVRGDLPWDSGVPDGHLARALERHGVAAGRALTLAAGRAPT